MSRVGNKIITVPATVTVDIADGRVLIKGPKGELKQLLPKDIKIFKIAEGIKVEPGSQKSHKAMWGTVRALIYNMVQGVVEGYEKKLEIEGIGYKAQLQGDKLVLSLGFSHPIEFQAPSGIVFKVEKNVISISGIDKAVVGEVAAKIRKLKKPEPYKGKGIRYEGEVVRRKAGKKASGTA